MKIEKLPSGSYRVRKMYKGKTYTVVFDYKPTQKEILQALSDKMDQEKEIKYRMTFSDAADSYVELKRNILSPASVREYSKIPKRLSERFSTKLLNDITSLDVQKEINDLTKKLAPKTVSNYYGFIYSVLKTYRPTFVLNVTLPQKTKKEVFIPTEEEIRMVLQKVKGTNFEIPIILACYGMRRSEICALTANDIDGDTVRINKAMVQNENREWVIKSTKTTLSTREIIIPIDVANRIKEQGYAYKGYPGSISNHLARIEKELGLEHFSLHKLRHYFASKLSSMNVPEADILKLGGWSTDNVMKSVYRHSLIDKEKQAQREVSNKLSNVLLN